MAEVKLNNVPFTIRLRRGLRAAIYGPAVHYNHAEVPEGELLYTTDTQQLYHTTAISVQPVQTVNMIVVHESEIMFHDGEIVVSD